MDVKNQGLAPVFTACYLFGFLYFLLGFSMITAFNVQNSHLKASISSLVTSAAVAIVGSLAFAWMADRKKTYGPALIGSVAGSLICYLILSFESFNFVLGGFTRNYIFGTLFVCLFWSGFALLHGVILERLDTLPGRSVSSIGFYCVWALFGSNLCSFMATTFKYGELIMNICGHALALLLICLMKAEAFSISKDQPNDSNSQEPVQKKSWFNHQLATSLLLLFVMRVQIMQMIEFNTNFTQIYRSKLPRSIKIPAILFHFLPFFIFSPLNRVFGVHWNLLIGAALCNMIVWGFSRLLIEVDIGPYMAVNFCSCSVESLLILISIVLARACVSKGFYARSQTLAFATHHWAPLLLKCSIPFLTERMKFDWNNFGNQFYILKVVGLVSLVLVAVKSAAIDRSIFKSKIKQEEEDKLNQRP